MTDKNLRFPKVVYFGKACVFCPVRIQMAPSIYNTKTPSFDAVIYRASICVKIIPDQF